jgi:hypothetical protein
MYKANILRIGDFDLEKEVLTRCLRERKLLAYKSPLTRSANLQEFRPSYHAVFYFEASDSIPALQLEIVFNEAPNGDWNREPPHWLRLDMGETNLSSLLDVSLIDLEHRYVLRSSVRTKLSTKMLLAFWVAISTSRVLSSPSKTSYH